MRFLSERSDRSDIGSEVLGTVFEHGETENIRLVHRSVVMCGVMALLVARTVQLQRSPVKNRLLVACPSLKVAVVASRSLCIFLKDVGHTDGVKHTFDTRNTFEISYCRILQCTGKQIIK